MIAVVAYPRLDVADTRAIEAIRTALDPQARRIAAHVTLVFPVDLKPEDVATHCGAVAASSRPIPFVIRRAMARREPDSAGGRVFYVPEEGPRDRGAAPAALRQPAQGASLAGAALRAARHPGRRSGLGALRGAGRAPDHRRPPDVRLDRHDLADRDTRPARRDDRGVGHRHLDRDRAVRGPVPGCLRPSEQGLADRARPVRGSRPGPPRAAAEVDPRRRRPNLVAVDKGVVLGVCATIVQDSDTIEFAKFAVAPEARGRGIGRHLTAAALAWARDCGARKVMLLSSRKLDAALRLYEQSGFTYGPLPAHVPYSSADVYMEMTL